MRTLLALIALTLVISGNVWSSEASVVGQVEGDKPNCLAIQSSQERRPIDATITESVEEASEPSAKVRQI